MRYLRPAAAIALLTLLAGSARADLPGPVKRYLDESTIAVMRVDLSRARAEPVVQFLRELAGSPDAQAFVRHVQPSLAAAEEALRPLREADVGEAFVVFQAHQLVTLEPPVLIVPASGVAQAQAVADLATAFGLGHERTQDAVLVGSEAVRKATLVIQPADRPVVAAQFAAREAPAVQLVFEPTGSVRFAADQALTESSAGAVKIVQSFQWGRLSLSLPPTPGGEVTLSFADEAAAQQMARWLEALAQEAVRAAEAQQSPMIPAELARVLTGSMRPRVEGKLVRMRLEERDLRGPIGEPLMNAASAMHQEGLRVRTGSNLRMLGQWIRQMLIDDPEGRYPTDLNEALALWKKTEPNFDTAFRALMTNPRNGVYPGFAYVRPAERDKDVRWNAVLMYEKPRAGTQPAESVAVLFADGSVRFMPLQELEKEAQRQEFEIVRLPAD